MSNIYQSDYMRKLLIERPYIRAKLENPGGSVILTGVAADTERQDEYSTQIGSGFHLDLIETEIHLQELPADQLGALIVWANGLSAKQAAMYFAAKGTVLRKRRERGVEELTKRMNDGESTREDVRGTSGRHSKEERHKTPRFT
jgi:hypothetical protein